MQVARAGVVAEPGPEVQHLVERCGGQIGDGGKARHKAFEIGNNGGDLGLLQHNFREPHLIGRFLLLPRQGLAAKALIPVQHLLRELRRLHHKKEIFRDYSTLRQAFQHRRGPGVNLKIARACFC